MHIKSKILKAAVLSAVVMSLGSSEVWGTAVTYYDSVTGAAGTALLASAATTTVPQNHDALILDTAAGTAPFTAAPTIKLLGRNRLTLFSIATGAVTDTATAFLTIDGSSGNNTVTVSALAAGPWTQTHAVWVGGDSNTINLFGAGAIPAIPSIWADTKLTLNYGSSAAFPTVASGVIACKAFNLLCDVTLAAHALTFGSNVAKTDIGLNGFVFTMPAAAVKFHSKFTSGGRIVTASTTSTDLVFDTSMIPAIQLANAGDAFQIISSNCVLKYLDMAANTGVIDLSSYTGNIFEIKDGIFNAALTITGPTAKTVKVRYPKSANVLVTANTNVTLLPQ